MALLSTGNFVTAEGNSATTKWPYTFKILGSSDHDQTNVVVTITDRTVSPEIITILSNNDFSIKGVGSDSGGEVTYPISGAPLSPNKFITIERVVSVTQQTSFTNQGAFLLQAVQDTFDYQMAAIQQYVNRQDFMLQFPVSDPNGPPSKMLSRSSFAGRFLAFDSNGNPIASSGTPTSSVAVSSFMEPRLGSSNAASFNSSMGLASFTARGDLMVGSTTGAALALSIGSNGFGLRADTTATAGMRWTAIANPGINNLRGENNVSSPSSKFDISFSSATLRNSLGGTLAWNTPGALTVDWLLSGPIALGRDQIGAFSSDSWTYLYLIGSPTTVSAIVSLNPSSPTLPTGYSFWALAAALRYNTSSSISQTYVRNEFHRYKAPMGVSDRFLSVSTITTSEQTASFAAYVPPVALSFQAQVGQTISASGSGYVSVATDIRVPAGNTAAQFISNAVTGTADYFTLPIDLPYTVPTLGVAFSAITNIASHITFANILGYRIANGAR